MFKKTATDVAPWFLIEGNYKWHARVKVLKVIARTFEKAFDKTKKRKKRK